MKPAPFELYTASTLEDAVTVLAQAEREALEARVLAGGQSLVALMNLRLARPELLVDLNRVPELDFIDDADGDLRIGAMTRQRTVELSSSVRHGWGLLSETLPFVAHAPIRNRGTMGGTLAHADPGAEMCAVGLALDARVQLAGTAGRREVPLTDFFAGPFMTTIDEGEVLAEIVVPPISDGIGWHFEEVARRRGDFAMAGVAAMLGIANDGTVDHARLAFVSVSSKPTRIPEAEQILLGERPERRSFEHVADVAVKQLAPSEDIHASREFRLHLARVLTVRVLGRAAERAGLRRG